MTDKQWERLEPLLPARKRTGRPPKDHRLIINGILWVLRTGAPWRDLPERYGPWQTVYSRFYRWRKQGVWDALFATVQAQSDAAGNLDWSVRALNGLAVWALVWSLVASGYGFVVAFTVGAWKGIRGLTAKPYGLNTLLFGAHVIGASGSLIGIATVIYGVLT